MRVRTRRLLSLSLSLSLSLLWNKVARAAAQSFRFHDIRSRRYASSFVLMPAAPGRRVEHDSKGRAHVSSVPLRCMYPVVYAGQGRAAA